MGERANLAALGVTLKSMPREQASGVGRLALMTPSIAEDVDTRIKSSIGAEGLRAAGMLDKAAERENYANGTPSVAESLMKSVIANNTRPVQLNPDLVKAVAAVSGMKEQEVASTLDRARLAGEQSKGGVLSLFKSDEQKRAGQEVDAIYATLQESIAKKMGEATSVAAKTQAKVDPVGTELTPKPDYKPKALDTKTAQKLLEELAPMKTAVPNGEAKIKAIMTLAQASPELAEDMLKKVQAVKKSAMDAGILGGLKPSQASLDDATKTFIAAAVTYAQKSGGANMDPVIDALATLKDANTPTAKAKLTRDIRTAAVGGAVAGTTQVEIDTGGPDNPDRAALEQRRDEARKAAAKGEAGASEDFSMVLLKMFVMVVASLFGIDASKLFGGGEPERTPAPTGVPAPAAATPPAPAAGADNPAPAAGVTAPVVAAPPALSAAPAPAKPAYVTSIKVQGVDGVTEISAEMLQKAIKAKNPNANLGNTGPNGDGVDGRAGGVTMGAFLQARKDGLFGGSNKDSKDFVITAEEYQKIKAAAEAYKEPVRGATTERPAPAGKDDKKSEVAPSPQASYSNEGRGATAPATVASSEPPKPTSHRDTNGNLVLSPEDRAKLDAIRERQSSLDFAQPAQAVDRMYRETFGKSAPLEVALAALDRNGFVRGTVAGSEEIDVKKLAKIATNNRGMSFTGMAEEVVVKAYEAVTGQKPASLSVAVGAYNDDGSFKKPSPTPARDESATHLAQAKPQR